MAPADDDDAVGVELPSVGEVHADGPAAVERDGGDLGVGDERDVGAGRRGRRRRR